MVRRLRFRFLPCGDLTLDGTKVLFLPIPTPEESESCLGEVCCESSMLDSDADARDWCALSNETTVELVDSSPR